MKIGPAPRVAAAWAQKGKDPGPPGPATPPITVSFPDPGPGATAMRPHGASAIKARAQSASVSVKNPLSWDDCPDPSVLRLGADYIIANTGSLYDFRRDGPIFPLRFARNGDFNELDVLGHAIERTPAWLDRDPWAPDLHHDDEMGYAITFTGRGADGRLAIGIAFAEKADGPYRERGVGPFLRSDEVGLIDSHIFFDPIAKQRWFLWKEEWSEHPELERKTPLLMQRLVLENGAPKLVGERKKVLENDLPFEGPVVEGASIFFHEGRYFLFYSGGTFYDGKHAVSVARSDTPTGPYEKIGAPLLANGEWCGRGHGFPVATKDAGGDTLFFCHGYHQSAVGPPNPRVLLMFPIEWRDGWPRIDARDPTVRAKRQRAPRSREHDAPGKVPAGVERAEQMRGKKK